LWCDRDPSPQPVGLSPLPFLIGERELDKDFPCQFFQWFFVITLDVDSGLLKLVRADRPNGSSYKLEPTNRSSTTKLGVTVISGY